MERIIRATTRDIPRIVDIFREGYRTSPWNEQWSRSAAVRRITDYFTDHEIFVLKIDGVVEGFVVLTTYMWHTGLRGFLHEIVVSQTYRGRGYGKKLILFVEQRFKNMGVREINLMTSDKSLACKIYKKMNYQKEKNFISMYKKI